LIPDISPRHLAPRVSPHKEKPAKAFAPAGIPGINLLRFALTRLGYVRRLRPFWTLHDLELDRISFLQRPVTISDDR
jgi:hypothetical protein